MLYKKYHRNFVKQFKKGVKFRYQSYRGVVTRKPYYFAERIAIDCNFYDWVLVFPNGQLDSNMVKI